MTDQGLEELLTTPIELPENPYWEVFKRFGKDEFIALIINALGTAGMSCFLKSRYASN